jgi:hypothetical protein
MRRKFLVSIYILWCISGHAQSVNDSLLDREVTISFNKVSLSAALRQINRQVHVNFSYNSSIIPKTERISADYNQATLRDVLTDLLDEANLYFREVSGTIIILKRILTDREIIGRVVDAKTQAPLPYANVFIDNSTLGAATNVVGEFIIKDIPYIAFNLVTSYVGYTSKTIRFNNSQKIDQGKFIIELEIEEKALDPFQITARKTRLQRRRDRKLLKRFEEDFLGRDGNAKDSRIVNPEVLELYLIDSLDNYEVSATDILFIENYAMGYRIGYLLEEFSFKNGIKTTIGKAQFKELEAKSKKQNLKWDEARSKAYHGSVNHFLNSMIENKLTEEGFSVNVVQFDSVTSEYSTPLNPPSAAEIISLTPTNKEFEFKLNVKSNIEVTYKHGYEDEEYKKLYRSKSKTGNYKYTDQKSRSTISLSNDQSLTSYQVVGLDISDVPLFQKSVILFQQGQPIIISYPGYFASKRSALYLGWWTWGGFSVKLPLNYKPEN